MSKLDQSYEVISQKKAARIRTFKNILQKESNEDFNNKINCYLCKVDPDAFSIKHKRMPKNTKYGDEKAKINENLSVTVKLSD